MLTKSDTDVNKINVTGQVQSEYYERILTQGISENFQEDAKIYLG